MWLVCCGASGVVATALADTDVQIEWPASGDTNVVGHRIYYYDAQDPYPLLVDAGGANSAVISGLEEGRTYRFALTAYDRFGVESLPSPEISFWPRRCCH